MGWEVLMGDNVPSRLKLLRSARQYISVLTVNMQEKFAQNRPIYIIYCQYAHPHIVLLQASALHRWQYIKELYASCILEDRREQNSGEYILVIVC